MATEADCTEAAPTRAEVDRVARLLIAEWERVEHKPVNISRIATFVDMARVAIADTAALRVAAERELEAMHVLVAERDSLRRQLEAAGVEIDGLRVTADAEVAGAGLLEDEISDALHRIGVADAPRLVDRIALAGEELARLRSKAMEIEHARCRVNSLVDLDAESQRSLLALIAARDSLRQLLKDNAEVYERTRTAHDADRGLLTAVTRERDSLRQLSSRWQMAEQRIAELEVDLKAALLVSVTRIAKERGAACRELAAAQQRIAELENDLMATQILAGANDRRAIRNAATLRAIAPVFQAAGSAFGNLRHGPGGRGGPGECDAGCVKCSVSTARAALTPELLAVIDGMLVPPTPDLAGADRDLRQRVMELEAGLANSLKHEAKLEKRIRELETTTVAALTSYAASLEATLRAVIPAYRATSKWFDADESHESQVSNEETGRLRDIMKDALTSATSGLTPDLMAVIERFSASEPPAIDRRIAELKTTLQVVAPVLYAALGWRCETASVNGKYMHQSQDELAEADLVEAVDAAGEALTPDLMAAVARAIKGA